MGAGSPLDPSPSSSPTSPRPLHLAHFTSPAPPPPFTSPSPTSPSPCPQPPLSRLCIGYAPVTPRWPSCKRANAGTRGEKRTHRPPWLPPGHVRGC
ncbi:hypothetical protein FEZ30_16310 [Acidipropionibacterium acidipropionici]|nr:hypothetical protein FEZ30_16310 [Acidipropionibacterium acidipropionici]